MEQPREGDCGYDLRSAVDVVIEPDEQVLVKTDVRMELPSNCWGSIRDRSSVASQRVYTHGGVIDPAYRGEIKVLLENRGSMPVIIKKGHKIAQLIVIPFVSLPVVRVDSLDETERGEDGFGSTGQ